MYYVILFIIIKEYFFDVYNNLDEFLGNKYRRS